MKILVLSRINLRHVPYDQLLEGDRVFLIASRESVDDPVVAAKGFERVEIVDDYERSGRVELLAVAMHRELGFDRIVAISEFDLIRAARLRDFLGIEGQSHASALAFRDKLVMKDLARAGGVRVPRYRRIETPLDVLEFVEDHGFGVVVKPVLGAGAESTYLIHDAARLKAVLDGPVFAADGTPSALEVESFVPGRMYSVDGYIQDGKIAALWPFAYLKPCHDYVSGAVLSAHSLAATNPLAPRLNAFVETLLRALPTPKTTGLHAEIFHTPEDELVLCEIASRVGGPRIPDVFRTALGFDLVSTLVQGLAGRQVVLPLERPRPRSVAADMNIPAQSGVLTRAPSTCPLPGVIDYRLIGDIGTAYEAAVDLTDFVATFLFRGDTEEETVRYVHDAQAWFESETTWS